MERLLKNIRYDLKSFADEKTQNSFQRFFKEKVLAYGVKTAFVGKVSKKFEKEIKQLPKEEFFSFCESLYKSDYCEEAFLVSYWAHLRVNEYSIQDWKVLEGWIEKYINNWAKCDGFCNHTIGDFLEKFPQQIPGLKIWAKSKNRWIKRAAAVSLIVPAKQGKYLQESFEISDILLEDKDDMVQKGYGWLLKEQSRKNQKEVLAYVIKNKEKMPRTALRYAIELMPNELRQEAMKK